MKKMKKKYILLVGAFLGVSASVYAGTAWVDYSTGQYQCNNNYKDKFEMCRKDSGSWLGERMCLKQVAGVCGNDTNLNYRDNLIRKDYASLDLASSFSTDFDRSTSNGWMKTFNKEGVGGISFSVIGEMLQRNFNKQFERDDYTSTGMSIQIVKNHPFDGNPGNRVIALSADRHSKRFKQNVSLKEFASYMEGAGIPAGKQDKYNWWKWTWTTNDSYLCEASYHPSGTIAVSCEKNYKDKSSMY